MEQIEKEIIAILSDVSGVDEQEIKPETDLMKDLDIDSIKAIEIIVAIEKRFKVSIRDEDIPKIATLKDAVQMVTHFLRQKDESSVKH